MNLLSLLVFVLFTASMVAFLWRRWTRRLVNGLARVDAAWKELERTLAERVAALEAMHAALERAGYVPDGRPRLRETVARFRQASGPRDLAAADQAAAAVLIQIYRGLPRERIETIREAQNRLAHADEERDLARARYNDLSLSWLLLAQKFPFRSIARRQRLVPREPFLLLGEEADYARRQLSHP